MRARRWRRMAIVVVLALAILNAWAFWLEPASLVVRETRIELSRRPGVQPLRAPLTIAVMSDLHVGSPFNGLSRLHTVVDRANDARADVICILGDLVIQGVIGGTFVAPEPIAAELGRLRATNGVFAVLGNHDGWFDHDRVASALRTNGIVLVEDTAVKVDTQAGSIWVAGISDLWTGRHDLTSALAAVRDETAPVILLTHNPDIFPSIPDRVTLTLAGHTHGGQVNFPFVGRLQVPSRFGQRYAAGHVVENGRDLFVTTGIGMSILPVRFRVPPVIDVLTLAPAR